MRRQRNDNNKAAVREGFAQAGDNLVVTAGVPFGISGTTNLPRIVAVPESAGPELT